MSNAPGPRAVSQYPPPPRRFFHSTPPPPPPTSSYQMFGRTYTTDDTLPSLEQVGRTRLYDPSLPPCQELRRMNGLLLQRFLTLVERLCAGDGETSGWSEELVKEIEDVFINMQHLINVMRPKQAALDLIRMLEKQTESRKEMTDRLKESVRKAWDLVGEAAGRLGEAEEQEQEDEAQAE